MQSIINTPLVMSQLRLNMNKCVSLSHEKAGFLFCMNFNEILSLES